ncbi:hypothetical protein MRX96_029720 [Rhipicephalus microplus]
MSSPLHCKRQLTGFGPLLDWRPLDFVDTVPKVFCCTLCGVMPAFPKRLTPCCHVFCQPCFDSLVQREHCCPLDQTPFAYDAVETLDSVRGGIYQLRALCPNSSSGCTLVAFLPELKEHVAGLCDFIQVQCPRCGTAVFQKAALSHYLNDCAGAQRKVGPQDASVSEGFGQSQESRRLSRRNPRIQFRNRNDGRKQPEDSCRHQGPASREPWRVPFARHPVIRAGCLRWKTSLIKTGRKGGSSSKFDLPKRRTAKASKNAVGVPGDDKALSERQLLDWVDSLLAKVTGILTSADDVAVAVAAEGTDTSNPSSSGSGSGQQ